MKLAFRFLLALAAISVPNAAYAQNPNPGGGGGSGGGGNGGGGDPLCVYGVSDGTNTGLGHALADGRTKDLKLCAVVNVPGALWDLTASARFRAQVLGQDPFEIFDFRSSLAMGKDGAIGVPVQSGIVTRAGGDPPVWWNQSISKPGEQKGVGSLFLLL